MIWWGIMYNYACYGYCIVAVYDHKMYTWYSKGGHNSVLLDTVAMGLPSSEAVEVPGNRLPAHGVYGSITQILPVPAKSYSFLVCTWHYIPCPHPVGSMVADSWKNNISLLFFLFVAMLQCYDIACSLVIIFTFVILTIYKFMWR